MTEMLVSALTRGPEDKVVCVDHSKIVTMGEFRSQVQILQQCVEQEKVKNWVLYDQNPYYFLLGLFAVLKSGSNAYIATKGQMQSIEESGDCHGFIGSGLKTNLAIDVSTRLTCGQEEIITRDSSELKREEGQVCFLTSGSTGQPKRIFKTTKQLLDETQMFADYWSVSQNSLFVSLVSHQHIYGLGFSYLLPLLIGAPFYKYSSPGILGVSEPIDIHGRSELSDIQNIVVVGSPTVGRMIEKINKLKEPRSIGDESREVPVSRVFSAGGKLSESSLENLFGLFDSLVTEILGSTETGAIATREHAPLLSCAGSLWAPFPDIEIGLDQSPDQMDSYPLSVVGAHTGGTHEKPVFTGDMISMKSNGKFELQGRIDRIRKIEGKRVSLDDINQTLERHEFVEEAFTTSLENNSREYIASCLVLSQQGLLYFRENGKFALDKIIRQTMLTIHEPITLPKSLVYVETIEKNSQGKILANTINQIFLSTTPTLFPQIQTQTKNEIGCEIAASIPVDLEYLKGHFNHLPVVPGLILLHWIHSYCESILNIQVDPARVSRLKFSKLVQPGDQIKIQINTSSPTSISFKYLNDSDETMSSGIVYPI